MSRWLRLTVVMAAAAFVVAFRFSADGNDADAGPVVAERAAAAVEAPTPATTASVRLAPVVELPALAAEPAAQAAAREKKEAEARKARAAKKKAEAAKRKRAAAKRKKQAAAKRRAEAAARRRAASTPRVVVTPVPTVRPTTRTYTPPTYTPPPAKPNGGYVGKDFDSEG